MVESHGIYVRSDGKSSVWSGWIARADLAKRACVHRSDSVGIVADHSTSQTSWTKGKASIVVAYPNDPPYEKARQHVSVAVVVGVRLDAEVPCQLITRYGIGRLGRCMFPAADWTGPE
jgi:hypothetical protein